MDLAAQKCVILGRKFCLVQEVLTLLAVKLFVKIGHISELFYLLESKQFILMYDDR
jgi:hypothetical protein